MYCLLFLLSLCYLTKAQIRQQGPVTLYFSCWYPTYSGNGRAALFGYNGSLDYPFPTVSVPNNNRMDTSNLLLIDGVMRRDVQPLSSFYRGYFPLTLDVSQGNEINWTLRDATNTVFSNAFVNLRAQTDETLCRNVFKGRCDGRLFANGPRRGVVAPTYFCDDRIFCNGFEFCKDSAGICETAGRSICGPEQCNEEDRSCGIIAPNVCLTDTDCGRDLTRYCVFEGSNTRFGVCRDAVCPCLTNTRADLPCLSYVCCLSRQLCFSQNCTAANETCDLESGGCVARIDTADERLCTHNTQCNTASPADELCIDGRCQTIPCRCATPTCHLAPNEVAGCYSTECNAARNCYAIECTTNGTPTIVFIFVFLLVILLILVIVCLCSFVRKRRVK